MMQIYEKIRTLKEQLESETHLEPGTWFVIDKYDNEIGTIQHFYPKERYNEAVLIVIDVNDSRFVITYDNHDSFLECFSPDDGEGDDDLFQLDDIFIAKKLKHIQELEELLNEFRLKSSQHGDSIVELMALRIIELEKKIKTLQ